ncbi:MAG: hypothetical protein AAGE94_15730 [Acidobacteriota bacterium]
MERSNAPCWILWLLMALTATIAHAEAAPAACAGFELRSGDHALVVRAQTADEAYGYLVRTLGDMEFFRANGYDVALPDHPAFAPDAPSIGSAEVFAAEVYDATIFERAIAVLTADREILSAALEWFATKTVGVEGFRAFDRYEVTLTLYGPGGSYDPDTGGIVLFTTPDGRFKGGGGTYTIVHEMMHLAVEEGLVQRFGLGHWETERLVDLLVQREFSDTLIDYRLQSQGDAALDAVVADTPLVGMAQALEHFVSARGHDEE